MQYLSIDDTKEVGQSLLTQAQLLAKQAPETVHLLTAQVLEDQMCARLIELGLQSGLASAKETQRINKRLGLRDAL